MTGEADRFAFETVSKPAASNSAEFALIAKMAASVDTLDGFIREMKIRTTARAPIAGNVRSRAGPYRRLARDIRHQADRTEEAGEVADLAAGSANF